MSEPKLPMIKIPLDVLDACQAMAQSHFTLNGVVSHLRFIGMPADAGRLQGIADALALVRASVIAAGECRAHPTKGSST